MYVTINCSAVGANNVGYRTTVTKPFQFGNTGQTLLRGRNRWHIWVFRPEVSKVKCTLVQALRLWTGRTAHRGSKGIVLLFLVHGTRRRWGVSVTLRPPFTPGKDPEPIVQEAGWTSGPVWTAAKNLASTGIRSPDRPARSQSLYRLSYLAHYLGLNTHFMTYSLVLQQNCTINMLFLC